MSDKKQLVIIFLAAFAIAFGSLVYMAGEIDKMAQADKQGSVDIRTFCSEGLAVSYTHLTLPTNREV